MGDEAGIESVLSERNSSDTMPGEALTSPTFRFRLEDNFTHRYTATKPFNTTAIIYTTKIE